MATPINVVSKEEVIEYGDVPVNLVVSVVRGLPEVKEPHEVGVLAVNIAKDLDGGLEPEYNRLVLDDLLCLVTQFDDLLGGEGEPAPFWLIDVALGLQESVQKFHVEWGTALLDLHARKDDVDLDVVATVLGRVGHVLSRGAW